MPSSVLGITENDTWDSLRVGVNGEIMLWDRLKLSGDVAYISRTFTGLDIHHHQRTDVANQSSPETGNGGHAYRLKILCPTT